MDEVKLLIDLMGHKNSEYVRNQLFCYFGNLAISYNGSELAILLTFIAASYI